MKLSPKMLETLGRLQLGKTTAFGYAEDTQGFSSYLNGNSVKALIRRGLLEQCGERPWQTYIEGEQLRGKFVPVYHISEAGRQALLDTGEWVQIPVESFSVDPALIQKALDLQSQERFEQWKATNNVESE